jgi:hypothetical protein
LPVSLNRVYVNIDTAIYLKDTLVKLVSVVV